MKYPSFSQNSNLLGRFADGERYTHPFGIEPFNPLASASGSPPKEIVVDTGPSDLLLLHPTCVFVSSLVDKVPIMLLMKP